MEDQYKAFKEKYLPKLTLLWANVWSLKSFAVTAFCIALFGTQSLWFSKKYNSVVGDILLTFQSWIDDSCILNLTLSLIIVLATVCYVIEEVKKRRFDGIGLSIFVFLLFYVARNSYWEYSDTIIPIISYQLLFVLGLIAIVASKICSSVNLLKDCLNEPNTVEGLTGYIVREPKEKVDTGWESVAQTIAGKLLKSNVRNNSIAIGIAGAWGSGKTTFLEIVESKTEDDFTVIRFNPWNTDGAKQLASDFFNTLSANLNLSREAIKVLKKYSDLLSDFNDSDVIAHILEKIMPEDDNSLNTLKTAVQEAISLNAKPVLVIIDDVDRLEKDEIFEVLKLIRVTADFQNIAYIAAYDKDYVEKQIVGRVANAELFLRKIFTLEVVLPNYEPVLVPRQLCRDIKKIIKDEVKQNSLFKLVAKKDDGRFICTDYLKNFRDELSFVNQFATSIQSLGNAEAINEISIEDLFLLELIRFGNSDVYELLKKTPTSLLTLEQKTGGISVYSVDDDKYKELYYKDQQGDKYKKQTLYLLLETLFKSQGKNGLKYLNNYDKYFSLRMPEYILSANEFEKLINVAEDSTIDTDSILKNKRDSLFWHIRIFNASSHTNTNVYNIFRIILHLLETHYSDDAIQLMKDFSFRVRFSDETYRTKVIQLVSDSINKEGIDKIKLNKLISNLHSETCFEYDEDGEHSWTHKQDIINDDELRELANQSLDAYVATNGLPAISEILRPTGSFNTFLASLVAFVAYNEDMPEDPYKQQLAIDKLTELYKPKDTHKIYDFWKEIIPTKRDIELGQDDMMWDEGKVSIFKVFGDIKHYKKFTDSCFTVEDKENQSFLDNMGIQLPK